MRAPPTFLATAWAIARKDLLIEFRTRSAFFAAIVFALLAVVIFRFSWDPTAVSGRDLAPGVGARLGVALAAYCTAVADEVA
jgi:heme exporter protein B